MLPRTLLCSNPSLFAFFGPPTQAYLLFLTVSDTGHPITSLSGVIWESEILLVLRSPLGGPAHDARTVTVFFYGLRRAERHLHLFEVCDLSWDTLVLTVVAAPGTYTKYIPTPFEAERSAGLVKPPSTGVSF